MSKGRDRTIYRRDDGKWENKRNDAGKASSIHNTQQDAIASARSMLNNQGGGELTVMGRNGRIRSKDTISAYFEELQKLSGQLGEKLSYIKKEFEKPARFMEIMKAELESVGKAINSNIPAIDLSIFTTHAYDLQKAIQKSIIPTFDGLKNSFQELPNHIQEALLLLGENGWYLDLEMSLPTLWHLKKILDEGNLLKAENMLVEYFENRLSKIEKSILKKFPRRKHLLKAAFNAHRREEYCLSIPLFLAQTDGICKEAVGQCLFMKSNRKPQTAIYVDQIANDTFMAALLSPLAKTLPINASENERPRRFNGLNRHMVLHGESLDYGSKVNSLKAISLVNYVGCLTNTLN